MANISKIKVGDTSYGITATPTAHDSTATTYGAASASNYGHVKLSDNYTSSAGAAASGIGASSLAVYNAYNTLNSNLSNLVTHYSEMLYQTADDNDALLLPAMTYTPMGFEILLPTNKSIIITCAVNNRTAMVDIELGFAVNNSTSPYISTYNENVQQWSSTSATFVYTNLENEAVKVYPLIRTKYETLVKFVQYQCVII